MKGEFVFYDKHERAVHLGDTCYLKMLNITGIITRESGGDYCFDKAFLVKDYSDELELVVGNREEDGMNEWVITFRDIKTLGHLQKMNIISYLPDMHEELKILFAKTTMSQEELEAIDGIEKVRKPRVGTLCV